MEGNIHMIMANKMNEDIKIKHPVCVTGASCGQTEYEDGFVLL